MQPALRQLGSPLAALRCSACRWQGPSITLPMASSFTIAMSSRSGAMPARRGTSCHSACASAPTMAPTFSQASLPAAVQVPAGHKVAMETVGVGEITYECREKKDMAGAFEWAFVAPVATLYGADRKMVGKYYAGPTWEAADGSKVTGKQAAQVKAALERVKRYLASGRCRW